MPMRANKVFSRALALLLCGVLCLSLSLPALAAPGGDEVIYLRTAEDLCALSDRCALDSWSRNKRIVLTADISLRGVSFDPIATFSGTFDGGGHAIRDLRVTDALSPAGLFLTVERGAVINALTVEGQVTPSGTKEFVGGIAGRNYGTIESCSFFGVVSGSSTVGGIAGCNEESGLISGCTVRGSVSASRYTGGIVGSNLGTLRGCTNSAGVNTASTDPSLSLDDLSLDAASSLTDLVSVGAAESRSATSDTGGIAGCSTGTISDGCTNRGTVGYPHFGYNVGGIAGRSSGYISAAVNHGTVYGRKDVGGIVGQMEPYLHLSLRDDLIAKLRTELDKLNALVSATLDDVDRTNSGVSARLDTVSAYTNAAVDDADALSGQTTDFIDKNIASINELSDRVDDAMEALPDILKALESASDRTADAIDALEQCNKDLTMSSSDRAEVSAAANDIEAKSAALKSASESLREAIEELKKYLDGTIAWDDAAVRQLLSGALGDLSDALSAMADITADMAKITAILADFLKDAAPKAHDDIQKALDALGDASDSLGTATSKTRKLIEDLNKRDDITFTELGQDYKDTLQSLFDNLRSTMTELDALNDEMTADTAALTADLRAVNEQMSVVVNLFLDVFVDVSSAGASDVFEDTSDEDIDAVTFGKVCSSTNRGIVQADRNVGGVAGAMAIEYELDPEDDAKQSSSLLNRVYETKAIVQECTNRGSITGKKDCVGGIVGEMDLGITLRCYAYGSAQSETGSYVGGIAGLSASNIRACWAKLSLSGKSAVGGIVGSGSEGSAVGSGCTVKDCRSLVVIDSCDQFAGAVSGRDLGTFRGNLFVSDTLRGIDRRSLAGQAEPVEYEALLALGDVPEDFRRFTLKFVCEGETLRTLPFSYGDSLESSVYPPLADREDSYAVWDRASLKNLRFDTVVTAEYVPFRSALQSKNAREDGRCVFFVEGQFHEHDALYALELAPESEDFPFLADDRHTAIENYFSFLHERTLPAMTVYRSVAEQWELHFPCGASDTHTVRYLAPDGKTKNYAVLVRRPDGGWQTVETETMGSYLLFPVEDCDAEIAVLTTAAVWWLWAIAGVLSAGVLFLLVRLIRRGRRKKAARPSTK